MATAVEEERIKRNPLLRAQAITWLNEFKLRNERWPHKAEFVRIWGDMLLNSLQSFGKIHLRVIAGAGTEPVQEVSPYSGRD